MKRMVLVGAALLALATAGGAIAMARTAGVLDPTFGGDGTVTSGLTPGAASDVAIQGDGKIVAVGTTLNGAADFEVARYSADGTLDPTFGGDGVVTTDFGGWDKAIGVAIQGDGKIVAVGVSIPGPDWLWTIARYNTDGTLDATFGGDGTVTTDVAQNGDFGQAVAIQTDGEIVVGGVAGVRDFSGGSSGNGKFALVRYNPDGTLDPTFGGGGNVRTNLTAADDEVHGLAIQTDGKIVAVGIAGIGGSNWEAGLARYNADGTLDMSFGSGGIVITDFTPEIDFAFAVAIQGDGKIVTAGVSGLGGPHPEFALARYLPT